MPGEGLAAPVPASPGMASNLATSHLARSGLRVNHLLGSWLMEVIYLNQRRLTRRVLPWCCGTIQHQQLLRLDPFAIWTLLKIKRDTRVRWAWIICDTRHRRINRAQIVTEWCVTQRPNSTRTRARHMCTEALHSEQRRQWRDTFFAAPQRLLTAPNQRHTCDKSNKEEKKTWRSDDQH